MAAGAWELGVFFWTAEFTGPSLGFMVSSMIYSTGFLSSHMVRTHYPGPMWRNEGIGVVLSRKSNRLPARMSHVRSIIQLRPFGVNLGFHKSGQTRMRPVDSHIFLRLFLGFGRLEMISFVPTLDSLIALSSKTIKYLVLCGRFDAKNCFLGYPDVD